MNCGDSPYYRSEPWRPKTKPEPEPKFDPYFPDAPSEELPDMGEPPPIGDWGEPHEIPTLETRSNLLLDSWLKLNLPAKDYLLGELLCTTSRWIIYGETGVGKTLFALDLAGAIASGASFLNWKGCGRAARVMYFDGEMPAETFKERVEIIARRYGGDLSLYGYNREILKDGDLPPLNTEIGEKWLWREIEALNPDLIVFDSIMCLLAGSMSEEESWTPIKALVRKISSRRIAQIWLHHTGHDTSKGFGTKTREWEMDTVVSLTKAIDGNQIALEFKKARLRKPENRDQFESQIIQCGPDGWSGQTETTKGGRVSEGTAIERGILNAYDRLAEGVEATSGFDGKPVRKVAADAIRNEVKSRGLLDTNEKGQLTPTSRTLFRRAKTSVLGTGKVVENDGLVWRP
jgi:AAA domain